MRSLTHVALKQIEYLHGEPIVYWKKNEVKQPISQQGLQLAVLGKFSYGKPVIQELRKAIPIQCELKGPCSIGLIKDCDVLIKLSLMEDYIHLLSKPAFCLKVQGDMWQMRCTKWNPWQFEEGEVDEGKGKEQVGTTTSTTKVLTSDKVLGKPPPNNARQEWMQRRMNKYQRDKRGHIIEETFGKEVINVEDKGKEQGVSTKNKFAALEVKEIDQTTLRIPDGKGEDKAAKDGTSNPTGEGIHKEEAISSPNPMDTGNEVDIRRERTVNWVARRFGAALEDINFTINYSCQEIPSQTIDDHSRGLGATEATSGFEGHATGNPNVQETRVDVLQTTMIQHTTGLTRVGNGSPNEARINEGAGGEATVMNKSNGTVNPSITGEVSTTAAAQVIDELGVGPIDNTYTRVLNDSVGLGHQIVAGKMVDLNGKVNSAIGATMNPSLGSVYELRFRAIQEAIGDKEQIRQVIPHERIEHAIVPKVSGAIQAVPIAYALGAWQPMQIQINVPLMSPNQILPDIITHNVVPMDIQNTVLEQGQLEDEGEDESAAGNFKAVAREADLSPRVGDKSSKKEKKQGQYKEVHRPKRILPKRAVSQTK
ncbi:hypothetical protein A4A49_31374 [Nicotiana attenuata]|uniref:DUF4283 domain-containing protein n=1 Tax=Nicotiana attenuata TaxID=49451 RepID=A0A1J6KUN3_NICAT|nr:hypothetical protein A4A49_31374 [Nicotiana attenuata]